MFDFCCDGLTKNDNPLKNIKTKTEVNGNDELAEKSFNWTKWGIITATIVGVAAIIVTIIYS